MSETTDLPTLLRNQPPEPALPTATLREKAGSLHWEANRRALSGYGWAAFFLATFGWSALHASNTVERAGTCICMIGAIFLAYQWRRFAAWDMPHDLPVRHFLKTYRDELLRQQRLLQSGVLLSTLPLVLGIDITAAGHLAARHAFHPASLASLAAFAALILAFGWTMARLQSQQLQFRIDEAEAALRDAA
jgi:hypothetical protein